MIWFWIFFAVVLAFGFVVFRGSPYVPSQKRYIKQAFTELYRVTDKDVLLDIGSGDGIVLRQASRLGARAVGWEINPILVAISRMISRKDKKIRVDLVDFWSAKLPDDTTIIYVFSVVRDISKMTDKLQVEVNRLGCSVKLISYAGDFSRFRLIKKLEAYRLYEVSPLQSDKAQV